MEDPAARDFISTMQQAEAAKRAVEPETPTRFLCTFKPWRYFVSAFDIAQPNGARLHVYVCVAYEPLIGPIVKTLYRALAASIGIQIQFTGIAVWLGRRIGSQ